MRAMLQMDRRGLCAMGLLSLVPTWWAPANAQGHSFADIAEFRAFVMDAYRRRGVDKLAADAGNPARFTITIGEWSSTADVTNLFAYINANPADLAKSVERFVNSTFEAKSGKVGDSNIVAVIRSGEYVKSAAGTGVNLLHEPLGADLAVVYMADNPDSMSPIEAGDVPGRDLASIRRMALDNIGRWLPKVVSDDQLGFGTLYFVEDDTMLSPSLILLDAFWKSIEKRFPGDVLIALPRKDQLFIFDDGNPAVLQQARQLIEATFQDGFNLLSPRLYARRGGKIVAVSPLTKGAPAQ